MINRFLKLRNNSRLTKLNKIEYINLMTGNFNDFLFKQYDACVLRKYPMVLTQVPKLMALTPFVSICHAEFSMFGRVKSGTINASQLFFQGSHVFSIFKLRIHACNKNKITRFYRWQ